MKPSKLRRFRALAPLALLLAVSCGEPSTPPPPEPPWPGSSAEKGRESPAAPRAAPAAVPPRKTPPHCLEQQFAQAARANAASLRLMDWAPFRRPEIGWEVYAPLVGEAIETSCHPASQGFAAALARWQRNRRLDADGIMSPATFIAMKGELQSRRPFVLVSAKGTCPPPPAPGALAAARIEEGYGGKQVEMRPAVLAAYRRMVAAARTDPAVAADPRNLTIFSAYRSPEYDAARCERDQNCNGITRASCSPHRTGMALDLYVGAAPGYGPDSSADPNRLFQSTSAAYAWLVANAERFGFVNYPFEPWHWEWVGEQP